MLTPPAISHLPNPHPRPPVGMPALKFPPALCAQSLLKKTGPEHPDHGNLERALLKIETVVAIVNEGSRQADGVMRIVELQERFLVV